MLPVCLTQFSMYRAKASYFDNLLLMDFLRSRIDSCLRPIYQRFLATKVETCDRVGLNYYLARKQKSNWNPRQIFLFLISPLPDQKISLSNFYGSARLLRSPLTQQYGIPAFSAQDRYYQPRFEAAVKRKPALATTADFLQSPSFLRAQQYYCQTLGLQGSMQAAMWNRNRDSAARPSFLRQRAMPMKQLPGWSLQKLGLDLRQISLNRYLGQFVLYNSKILVSCSWLKDLRGDSIDCLNFGVQLKDITGSKLNENKAVVRASEFLELSELLLFFYFTFLIILCRLASLWTCFLTSAFFYCCLMCIISYG